MALLVALVVILASVVALFTIPARSVVRTGVDRFGETLPATWGPCAIPGTGGCWGGGNHMPIGFYCQPASAVGAVIGSLIWHSDNDSKVDLAFFASIPHTEGTLFYSVNNSTGGGTSFNPEQILYGAPACEWPLWFQFQGYTNVTLEGTLVYNYTATEPLW